MINTRRHYFPTNNQTVITGLLPTGEYGAYVDELDDGMIRGHGHSRWAAIADLAEQCPAPEPDPIDHQAARFDHNQDHRKNWSA